MKKLSKRCCVEVFIKRTNIITESHDYNRPCKEFSGTKNNVMHQLREYLLTYDGFEGEILAEILNTINKTSIVYNSLGKGVYETTIHTFNPAIQLLFTFKVKYDVERLSNLPSRYRTNRKGENLYEKRLIQLYGGGRLGRYRLAIENVNADRLLELLSPMIKAEFSNNASIEFSNNNHVKIDYPTRFEFKPNDDLSIAVRVNLNKYRDYTSSVDIVYKGQTVWWLNKYPSETITEENITEALKVVEQFDEICEIVKKAYNL